MSPKNLILDAGGVLVYPRLGFWNLPWRAPELLGLPVEALKTEAVAAAYRQALHWLDESALVADVEQERAMRLGFVREMDALLGWHIPDGTLRAVADDFTDDIDRYGFFDDLIPWMDRWKARYRLGLLSDAMPSLRVFLAQKGLMERFDAAVISTEIGATKPDGRMYAAILKALDARPEECLFVDDLPRNLEGARRAGIPAVQMCRAEFPPAERWDGPAVRSFEELDGFLAAGETP